MAESISVSLNPMESIINSISNLTGVTNGQIFIVLIIIVAAIAFYIVYSLGIFGSGDILGGNEKEQYDMADYIVDVA